MHTKPGMYFHIESNCYVDMYSKLGKCGKKDLKTSKLLVVLIIEYSVDFQPAHSLGRNKHFKHVRVYLHYCF